MAAEHVGDAGRSGVTARRRSGPGVQDERRAAVGERTPYGLEQRVVRGEVTDLQVRLEQLDTVVDQLACTYVAASGSG